MKIHVTRFIYRMTLTIILILFPRLLTLSTGGSTIIASVNTDGTQGNAPSRYPSITSDGRYTAFHSSASTLVIGDTNEVDDIFIYDQTNYSTVRVSVDSDGEEADGASQYAHISATGRYIVFESAATNLVDDDTNGKIDIFLRDRDTDDDGIFDEAGEVSTTLISLNATGTSGGNGDSSKPSITPNGRFIVFASVATNLVASDTNGTLDIFVRDRSLNSTALVSVSTSGTQANFMTIFNYPAITSDGRYVAFHSTATNLVGGDTNGGSDIFIHDRDTDVDGTFDEAGNIKTSRVSVTSGGSQSTGGQSFNPSMSASGRYVVFYSYATNLVSTDLNSAGDVFLVDRDTDGNGTYDDVVGHFSITRISKNTVGTEGNAGSSIFMNSISSDGRYAVFQSAATNLVSDDTNGYYDEFLHDNLIGSTVRISVDSDGSQAINGDSFYGAISADGQYVAFHSDAANLVSTDGNGFLDVFLHGNDFTPPQVISITRAGADPTSAASVDFTVTFSESVAGVDGDDFSLFTNGVSGTAISGVSGAGATRTITVNTGSGDGTIRLDLLDDDTITDLLGYVLGGTGPDNGNFSGEEYTVDKTIPIITSDGGGDTASLSIPENSTAVTTVTAMDPNAADTLTYSISGGADGDKFAIDESSGALAFVIAPDYENPTDTGINNGYEVIVRVSDGLLVDSQLIDVAVTNINETPVIQEGDSISRTVSFSLNLTLHATDPDGDTLTWDIAIPADHGDASASGTGISQVIGYTPDLFYLGLDSFEVRVSDGHGHEDTITIHINVDRHFTLLPLVIR